MKKYQKYLEDTKEWETERNRIIGSATEEGSLEYFKQEREYIEKHLQDEYKELRANRDQKVRELFVDYKLGLLPKEDKLYCFLF